MKKQFYTQLISILDKEDDNENNTEENMKKIIQDINTQIIEYDQEIKFIKHDLIDSEYIVFTNTVEASINKYVPIILFVLCNY